MSEMRTMSSDEWFKEVNPDESDSKKLYTLASNLSNALKPSNSLKPYDNEDAWIKEIHTYLVGAFRYGGLKANMEHHKQAKSPPSLTTKDLETIVQMVADEIKRREVVEKIQKAIDLGDE